MSTIDAPTARPSAPWALGIAALLVALVHGLTGHLDLDLRDEGFLWYGVVRTAAGEVPGADFQAYDPGRYYWGALWSQLLGPGILALRLSTAVFQAVGLCCGLLVLRRVLRHPISLLVAGAVLAAWMFPRHKLFEPSLAMMAVLAAVRLAEDPRPSRFFQSGLFVGVAAVFGRNHGLYCAIGFTLLILIQHTKASGSADSLGLAGKLGRLAAGTVLGFAPMLALLAFHSGFQERFVESLRVMSERGTNLPRPVPWPWTVTYDGESTARYVSELVLSTHYLLMACAFPLGFLWLLRTRGEALRSRAVLLACLCIGLPYVHHAVIRASASHLAQSVHPVLLGLFALPHALTSWRRTTSRFAVATLLFASAAVVAWGVNPHLGRLGRRAKAPMDSVEVAGDVLRLPVPQAQALANLQAVVAEHIAPDEAFFVAPFRAAYYPIFNKVAPVWDIYMLWKASPQVQEEMIRALDAAGVEWALLVNESVRMGSGETFSDTHPKVLRHLVRTFEPVRDPRLPADLLLLRRSTGTGE